jgi:hypothetical protein
MITFLKLDGVGIDVAKDHNYDSCEDAENYNYKEIDENYFLIDTLDNVARELLGERNVDDLKRYKELSIAITTLSDKQVRLADKLISDIEPSLAKNLIPNKQSNLDYE